MAQPRGKLVVIEDHKDLRDALTRLLESLGYEVMTAENARDGMDKARGTKPDLVFCDLNLTGLPCLDILKAIKEELPETKIIVTGTDTTCEIGERLGACHCLSHPISRSDLITALNHCLGHCFPDVANPDEHVIKT
jgi:DNA-binding NtrC family response regulator